MYIAIQKGKYTVLGSIFDIENHVKRNKGKCLILQVRYGEKALCEAINMLNDCISENRKYYNLSTSHFQSGAVFSNENSNTSPIHVCDTWNNSYGLDISAINADAMTYEEIYGKELTSD